VQVIELEGIPSTDNALKLMEEFSEQIPFAISYGLNLTAEEVRDWEIENLRSKFKLRRNWFAPRTRYGMNVVRSTKSNLQAEVFTRAPWLELQEYGGTKTKGTFVALTLPADDIRQDTQRLIPKSLAPSKVLNNLAKYHAFWIGPNLWVRFGKGRRDIKPLFFGKQSTRIPARLNFRAGGLAEVQRIYQKNFGKALAYAIATAKSNAG
jgi:hypothetical protein